MNGPRNYRVFDPFDDSLLVGATMNANGFRIVGGIIVGRSAAPVAGGSFTDNATADDAKRIIVKTGLAANLPPNLSLGEFAFTTDTKALYIGGGDKNEPIPTGSKGFVTVTPAALTADVNNYSAGGLSTTDNLLLRVQTDGGGVRTITGLGVGQAGGQMVIFRNVGSQNIILSQASGSSSAANQFSNGNPATDVTLASQQTASYVYDPTGTGGWVKF